MAVETSCDESAVAYFDPSFGVRESLVYSQVDLHALYGGVVPDLASAQHLEKLPPLIGEILPRCGDIDLVVATCGPGLPNCLAVGVAAAEGLALALERPLAGVNHLLGHAFSPFMEVHRNAPENFQESFGELLPHLGLVVSGGNTILFEMGADSSMRILAETADDAAGEALDKGAKLLGMPYPGGALLERAARGGRVEKSRFPYGQNRKVQDDPNFSFSGLKTSLRYGLEKLSPDTIRASLADICASYQFAVVEQLRRRAEHFLKRGNYASLGLSGGVSNNAVLSEAFGELSRKFCGRPLLEAPRECRGDNAAMIAFAAYISPERRVAPRAASLDIRPSAALC